MDRNDDNKDIIREARQKAKNEKEPKKNLTADEKDTKEEVKEKIVNYFYKFVYNKNLC